MKIPPHPDPRARRSPSLVLGLSLALGLISVRAWSAAELPELTINRSVLLSWPDRSTDSNVVVVADSIDGLYTPCLEPIFRRWGGLSTAVPITGAQQFFGLKPGLVFVNDCAEASGPWSAHFFDSGSFALTHTNGALRITGQRGKSDRAVVWPTAWAENLEDGRNFADFATSVDILAWDRMTSASIALYGRAHHNDEDSLYFGLLVFEGGQTRSLQICGNFASPSSVTLKTTTCRADPTKAHRLVFSGTGSRLTLTLLQLSEPAGTVASVVVTNSRVQLGGGGILLNAGLGQSDYDITVDNYMYVGARP